MTALRASRPRRLAVAGVAGSLALVVAHGPGSSAEALEAVRLWAGVAVSGAPSEWRPLRSYGDTMTCEVARREALDAARRGFRETGALELVRLGADGFLRVDPRTLETYVFRFACEPEAPLSPSTP
jgi:hypothetical protein